MMDRKKYLKGLKRIVIKIGSSSLASRQGSGLDDANLDKLSAEVKQITDMGLEVIIVTSGAIAAGLKYLDVDKKPEDISFLQAAASVGQVQLMDKYKEVFSDKGMRIGQILVTQEDTTRRRQYLNIKNTIEKLLELGVVPIINENDSSAVEEIKFGDNDKLAALISSLVESDLLVILTDNEGFYDKDPSSAGDAELISFIDRITPDIEKHAGGIGYKFGSGGMKSKLTAAKICMLSGIPMMIANSRKEGIIVDLVEGKDIGTLFVSKNSKRLKSMKRWIAFGMRSKGTIMLDKGAEKAVKQKGKSILAVGISGVEGDFNKGDTLKVMTHDNHLLAKGISNFSSKEVKRILGKNKEKILSEFGPDMCVEVIHRDCLVVFEED